MLWSTLEEAETCDCAALHREHLQLLFSEVRHAADTAVHRQIEGESDIIWHTHSILQQT